MVSVPCGYATEGQGVTPLGAAVDGGFMRGLGLDVTLRKMGDAHAVAAGLDSGEITFGNLAAPGLVEAVSRGAALVFLAGGVNQQFLVGAPGRSLADVAGQPMGASSPGDLTDFLVQITMERVTEPSPRCATPEGAARGCERCWRATSPRLRCRLRWPWKRSSRAARGCTTTRNSA